MTTGTSDFPDFQAVTQQHNVVIVNEYPATLPAGYTVIYQGPSSSWASLQARVFPETGYGQFEVFWYIDSAFTQGAGEDGWLVNDDTRLNMLYPVQAPYCKILFHNTTTTPMSCYIYVAGTQLQVERVRYLVTDQTVFLYDETIAGDGILNEYLGFIQSGQGTLTVNPHDTNGNVNYYVYATDETQTIQGILADLTGPTAYVQANFAVPDQPIVLHIVNTNGTTGRTFDASLVVAPFG
jgi:hypothetical protein